MAVGEVHLYVGVHTVEVFDEGGESIHSVAPNEEDVVLIPQPEVRTRRGRAESRCFPLAHVDVGKGPSVGLAHLNTGDLLEPASVVHEVVVDETQTEELENLLIRPGGIGVGGEGARHPTYALLDRYVRV